MKKIVLDGRSLTINKIKAVARDGAKVEITKNAARRCEQGYNVLQEKINRKIKIYGVTTGFGEFSQVFIEPKQAAKLQLNLLRSHSTGVGDPVKEEIVRATMLIRANFITSGLSGGRLLLAQTLVDLLNRKVTPYVLEQGSVGSSGDLAPLAMMMLTLIGEGQTYFQGKLMSSKTAMKKAGIPLVKLQAKEGLALINGDTFMAGMGSLELYDALQIAKISEIALATTIEAIQGVMPAYDEKLALARRFDGQVSTARNVRRLVEKSEILAQPPLRVQDAYSIRSGPVILGASREALKWVKRQFETENNAAQDNPLVFTKTKEVISGGNFHGQPLCMPLEVMAMATAEYANASEIRQERMNNPYYSKILPAFLIKNGGLNSGFMMPQYTAAALVNENKILCYPGIVDSIPVSAGQEDDCSMGTNAAIKIQRILRNTQYVLAIELMLGCQALDFKDGKKPGIGVKAVYDAVRSVMPYVREDIVIYPYLKEIWNLLKSEKLVRAVEKSIGTLEEPDDYLLPKAYE